MSSSKFDIVVYGATGFTGQLVAEYLAAHYKADSGLKWAMAGRSKDKLASVRDAIGAPKDTALIVADAGDAASLQAMVAQTKSVITPSALICSTATNCWPRASPSGADYLDLCGEPIWMRQMIDAARGGGEIQRRAHRVLLRLRFDSVRTRRVLVAAGGEEGARRAGQPRQGPGARHEGHVFRRHRGQRAGDICGGREGSQPGRPWCRIPSC